MKKSNLVLLIVFIVMIGTVSFTRSSLIKKFRNNEVTIVIHKESKHSGTPAGQDTLVFPTVRYIIFPGSQTDYSDFHIVDSAVTDKDGNPVMKIEYRPDLGYTETDKQFRLSGDTLFVDSDNISNGTIYTSGLLSVTARTDSRTKVSISGFRQDSLYVISDMMSNMDVSGCIIRHCRFEMNTGARIHSFRNKIDSLEVYVADLGILVLDDFSGKLVWARFEQDARVELSGSSLRSFSTIKWDD